MNNTILQQYLTLQFIPIDDESGVDKLKKSAEQLAKKLKKEKNRISQFTLYAIDPAVSSDDPIMQEVQELVIKNWPVFVNKAGGNNLVTYNRAVILEALSLLSQEVVEIAGIIWLTGSSVLKHYNLGREEEAITEWLKVIGILYESKAREIWAVSDFKLNGKLPTLNNSELQLKNYTVNAESLKEKLFAAGGPNAINESGQNVETSGNRYWPHNNPQHWVGDFGKIATEGISVAINSVVKANNKEVTTYLTQSNENLNNYLNQLKPYFENLGSSLLNKSNSLDLRSQLLWLKESQYSDTLNESYRIAESNSLPFYIANDIAKIVPPIYPSSVDYFAKEIARVSKSDVDNTITLGVVIGAISKDRYLQKEGPETDAQGRITLYNFVSGISKGKYEIENMTLLTGLTPETSITKTELLVWFLHDMQSIKLSLLK
jgi:hypothetical protein